MKRFIIITLSLVFSLITFIFGYYFALYQTPGGIIYGDLRDAGLSRDEIRDYSKNTTKVITEYTESSYALNAVHGISNIKSIESKNFGQIEEVSIKLIMPYIHFHKAQRPTEYDPEVFDHIMELAEDTPALNDKINTYRKSL